MPAWAAEVSGAPELLALDVRKAAWIRALRELTSPVIALDTATWTDWASIDWNATMLRAAEEVVLVVTAVEAAVTVDVEDVVTAVAVVAEADGVVPAGTVTEVILFWGQEGSQGRICFSLADNWQIVRKSCRSTLHIGLNLRIAHAQCNQETVAGLLHAVNLI